MDIDISYTYYTKKGGIHGAVLYPAPMIAPIQKDILMELINLRKYTTIFDPFHGSGIALYEAAETSANIFVYGYDINPLANLITKSKLLGVNADINLDINQIETMLSSDFQYPIIWFIGIEKWYREDIIDSLSKIKYSIDQIKSQNNRLYLWCIFTDIVRKYSNSRSSTFKLHIKPSSRIESMIDNTYIDFLRQAREYASFFDKHFSNWLLLKCDTLSQIKLEKNDFFDITITSPPYGDNKTTVPYGEFSSLAIRWISQGDLELDGWENETYSAIDSRSMGGLKILEEMNVFEKKLIQPYLDKIAERKRHKVLIFMQDYFKVLREICRVTKDYIVMTLGNRTVDGIKINLTEITKEYLEKNLFVNIESLERNIPKKRIAINTSCVYNKPVSSMNKEFVIIHKKKNLNKV